MLCHAVRAIRRDVTNNDTTLVSGLNVDVVITRCKLTDILQSGQLVEQLTCDIHLINKDTVGILSSFNDFILLCSFINNAVCYLFDGFP